MDVGTGNGQACGRFFDPGYPADYKFCYLPKGHDGPCKFEQRRKEARRGN